MRELIADAVDFVPPVSFRPFCMETSSSPKFPSYPFVCMPRSQIPVVPLPLAMTLRGLLPSAESNCVGFPSGALEVILLTTTIHISGFNNMACKLVPPGFAPSLTGTHAGFATDLPAGL